MSSDFIQNIRIYNAPSAVANNLGLDLLCLHYERACLSSHPKIFSDVVFVGERVELECHLSSVIAPALVRCEYHMSRDVENIMDALKILFAVKAQSLDENPSFSEKLFNICISEEGLKIAHYFYGDRVFEKSDKVVKGNNVVLNGVSPKNDMFWIALLTRYNISNAHLLS